MSAECWKCGHDVIDDCEVCALHEDLERQKALTVKWAVEATFWRRAAERLEGGDA